MRFKRKIAPETKTNHKFLTKKRLREDEIDPIKKIEPLKDGKNDRENLYFNLKEKPEAKYMFVVTTRDIEAGEELVADYTLYTFN